MLENIEKLNNSNNAAEIAYRGVLKACMANHCYFPYYKLKYFINGKCDIEMAIRLAPSSTEIRLLRLLIQSKSPAFLNYKKNIKEDTNYIVTALNNGKMPEELQKMVKYIMPLLNN